MNEVDEIKERINIVDLISGYLTLHKAGGNYKAQCPFHQEKTASFMVSPEKQIYKCFGCGEGGDIFEFVMKMEGLNFPEALQLLADRAGVMLQKQSFKSKKEYKQEKDTKSLIYKINKISTKIFNKILIDAKKAKIAREYLEKRKINQKNIDKFQIGYAPKDTVVKRYFYQNKVTDRLLKMAGNPEKFYDRIIFPIFDIMGNPIAFTGRTLSDEVQPKYLNTPETMIFHKGKVVYGLNFAKEAIKKQKFSIVVEGQMDVILSHVAGIENVVATSGTAITLDHLKMLSRFSDNVAFCFDNDKAGFEAFKKALKLSYEAETNAFVIELPDKYKDVGEIVENDKKLWSEIVKTKMPALEWLIDKSFVKDKTLSTLRKKELAKDLAEYIYLIGDPIEKDHYVKLLSSKLSVSERIINEIIARFQTKNSNRFINQVEEKNDEYKKQKRSVEDLMLGLMLCDSDLVKIFLDNFKSDDLNEKLGLKEFYKLATNCYDKLDNKSKTFKEDFKRCMEKSFESGLKEKVKFLVVETEDRVKNFTQTDIKNEFLDYISYLKTSKNKDVKSQYAKMIAQAENQKDIKKLKKLLVDFQNKISNK